MGARFHGVTSIVLMGVATVLAAITALRTSWLLGALYLALAALGLAGVLYAYCAKCPCRLHCGHVVPGKLVSAFVKREPGPYTKFEIAVVAVALSLLIALPQLWLWRTPVLLAAFWGLAGLAAIEIRAVVCRACDNVYCPARPAA
jgi:hypothetical protein